MISAPEALRRLREGNARFASNLPGPGAVSNYTRRAELTTGQDPFAIVLGCSDSRVPAEIVFDQGLGDLFVIRVAGNIVAPSQVGSVEFAAARFGTQLVVVLGHTQCGAVLATLEEIQRPTANQSRNLRAIVDRVRPSVEGLLAADFGHDVDALVKTCGAGQHPRVRESAAARLPAARAVDPRRWLARGQRGVFSGDGCRRFLRRRAGSRLARLVATGCRGEPEGRHGALLPSSSLHAGGPSPDPGHDAQRRIPAAAGVLRQSAQSVLAHSLCGSRRDRRRALRRPHRDLEAPLHRVVGCPRSLPACSAA